MLLAEIEVWHSRPVTPTRRVSLGHLALPVDPLPGFGGILLGGVIVQHLSGLDEELRDDLRALIDEIGGGRRIVQPRIRHRFQVDHHGLGRSVHRLVGRGDDIDFEFEDNGAPVPQLLGAVYAAERLEQAARRAACNVMLRAMKWTGSVGPALVANLSGLSAARSSSFVAFADPVGWARQVLGIARGPGKPSKREVMRHFREELRKAHPDHGGATAAAAQRIADLGEARRILLES